jgi:coatomer subunit beta
MDGIRGCIGDIPIYVVGTGEEEEKEDGDDGAKGPKETAKPKVLADGTYATESAFTAGTGGVSLAKDKNKPPLRSE